ALAAHNYVSAHGCLPQGTAVHALAAHPDWGPVNSNGPFVSLSQYLEQGTAFNTVNFNLSIFDQPNATVHAIGIATLWCPRAPTPAAAAWFGPYTVTSHHTSYCGNQGPWWLLDIPAFTGLPPDPTILSQNLGLFHQQSAVTVAQVTDGLSQTVLFGERAHGLI